MTGRPSTHDFGPTRRFWGHDYTITQVIDGGQKLHASGWGHDGQPIAKGDFLILESGGRRSTTRYRVDGVEYYPDPSDMWTAVLLFDPRKE